MDWMRVNKLRLNPDKTEVLLVGGLPVRLGDVHPVLDGVALPLKDGVCSLGVLLDPELSRSTGELSGKEHLLSA